MSANGAKFNLSKFNRTLFNRNNSTQSSQQYDETNKSEILSALQSNSHVFTTFVITSLIRYGTHMDLSWAWQEVP